MGIGDWGLGIGDWGLGIGPNPQSPIPNPPSPIPKPQKNNQIYQNFKQEFENDFGINNLHKLKRIYCSLDKEKNKITERRNYNNLSFSTRSNSSNKNVIQSQNSLISPIISKFNLNL